jgi:HAE1 family hydrophobic/amphiphilic exporter-1
VEFIRSTSYRQRSVVVVKFLDDVDYQACYDELRFRVLSILDRLPDGVDPPHFNYIDVNDWLPVVSINLVGDRSNRALSLMAKEMKVVLRRISGVKEVKLQGEQTPEFHLVLDPQRLSAYGITFDQVAQALQGANLVIPAGEFDTAAGELVIRADQRFRTRHQVLQTIVRTDADGSFVRVADLARSARLAYRDPVVLSSVNGKDCVTLQVIKTREGNALEIMQGVQRVLAEFRPLLQREGVELVLTRDSTVNINDSLRTLGSNLLLGVVLVWLVIWFFMGLRNAVITTVGIPFSFLFTMILMYLTGNSLNEITLFSFVLVSGIIVDDAIVVVENIYRHAQEGEPLKQAIVEGTAEVALPVLAATSTTVAAFLPMLIMTGSTGEFFALVPKAVSFAIAASLFECMLILPLHYQDWGPHRGSKPLRRMGEEGGDNPLMTALHRASQALLGWCMRHRRLTLGGLTLAFLAALVIAAVSFTGLVPLIKVQFFPDDYSLYYVIVDAPPGTSIEKTAALLKEIERAVMADGPGMAASAKGYAGYYPSEDYEPVFGVNLGHVAVTLPARDERHFADYPTNDPQAHLAWMARRLKEHFATGGVRIRLRPEKDGPPAGKDLNIRVVGPNPQSVRRLARAVMDFLRHDPELTRALTDLDDGRGVPSRVWRFRVREDRAAEYGLSPAQVIALASAVMNGRYVGKYRLVDEEVDFRLKLDPAALKDPQGALQVPVVEHPAGPVRLGDLVSVELYSEPGQLDRFQGQRAITITGNLRPGVRVSLTRVVERVRTFYRGVAARYPGATLTFAGEFESTRKSFTSLGYAFVIALVLIYLILAAQFSSYLQPVVILSAVVFAVIGVVFGKFLTQSLFTINSFIASVGVAGVVVNDALVLMDFLNRLRDQGLSRAETMRRAVRLRLRPILLTTITTTLGLLPMALGIPYYSVIWGTMATTFVTGLCTATFLTIFLIPVQWDILESLRARRARSKED